jgi:hypothetical protein
MASDAFNWIRPGYELVKIRLEWKVQLPFFTTTEEKVEPDRAFSKYFFSPQIPESKWKLGLYDQPIKAKIAIRLWHFSTITSQSTEILERSLVKMSIITEKEHIVLQKISQSNWKKVEFLISKQDIINSKCQEPDGNLIFCCNIFSHVKKEPASSADPDLALNCCSSELITQLEGLFNEKKFSDVIFNVHGRQFPAHKFLLAARSEVFAAMLTNSTVNQITIEEIAPEVSPEVFHAFLRFIYTGRMSITTMETSMTFGNGLFITSDKYKLDDLERLLLKVFGYAGRNSIPTVGTPDVDIECNGKLVNQLERLYSLGGGSVTLFSTSAAINSQPTKP